MDTNLADSLNLVVIATVSCCLETPKFFDFLEHIYTLFTGTSKRYNSLSQELKETTTGSKDRPVMPKRVSTRWASRTEAVNSVLKGFLAYKSVLLRLSENSDEAKSIYSILARLEMSIYLIFWNDLLNRVNKISTSLQCCNSDLNTSVELLKFYVESMRNNFEKYESFGNEKSGYDNFQSKLKRSLKRN